MESKKLPFEIKEIDPALKTFIDSKIAELKDIPQFGIDLGSMPSTSVESYAVSNIDGAIVWAHRSVIIPEIMRKLRR